MGCIATRLITERRFTAPLQREKKMAKKKLKTVKSKKKAPPRKRGKAVSRPGRKIDARRIFASSPVIRREGGGEAFNVRVLIGKAGLDGHDRGAKVIARACRDAGFEVVYTGLHQTPEMIVNTAIQEDVDVVGLSILSGAHNHLVPEVVRHLQAQGVKVGKDMLILIGGIIPESDFESLRKAGVSMVFTPGTSVEAIITYIRDHVKPKA